MDRLVFLCDLDVGWWPAGATLAAVWLASLGTRHARKIFGHYGTVIAHCGLSGHAAAQRLLSAAGLSHLAVTRTSRPDHYHAGRHEIQLNSTSYDSNSLAAVATAAHEVGHAQQDISGYLPCRLRRVVWPICSGLTVVCVLLLLMGFTVMPLHQAGMLICLLCGVSLLMQLPVVLPMEYDASRRALEIVSRAGVVTPQEIPGFERLLKAAGLTYVAAEARRWLILLVLAVLTFWVLPDVALEADSADLQAAEQTLAADGRVIQLMPSVLSTVAQLVVCGAIGVIIWSLVRRGQSSRRPAGDRAIELSNAGMALHARGHFDEALDKLNRAIELAPALGVACHNRGMVNLSLGRYDDALADFDRTLQITPDMCEAIVGRAEVWACRQEWARALSEYDRALGLYPAHSHALAGRGNVWLARERYDDAITDYTAALAHGADEPTVRCARGQACLFGGRPTEAIADFDRAIELGVDDAIMFNNRGVARLRSGDSAGALQDLDRARSLDPDLPNPYRHLAWIQATSPDAAVRDGRAAVDNALKALERVSDGDAEWQAVLAAAHAECGHFDEAIRCQTTCIAAAPVGLRAALQAQLQCYEAGVPWRELEPCQA